jgi:hypothetical protein
LQEFDALRAEARRAAFAKTQLNLITILAAYKTQLVVIVLLILVAE